MNDYEFVRDIKRLMMDAIANLIARSCSHELNVMIFVTRCVDQLFMATLAVADRQTYASHVT